MTRLTAYIDGFNLYYGLRSKGWHSYYGLDIHCLVENLLQPGQRLRAGDGVPLTVEGGGSGESPC